MAKRPSFEERLYQRQRERGPLTSGKYFEHKPAAVVFGVVLGCVIMTHVIAFALIEYAPK